MINTNVLSVSEKVIYHRVSGVMNETEAAIGSKNAIEIVAEFVKNKEKFSLILDMRGYVFDDFKSHKVWSLGFKEQTLLKENVNKVAVIGDESPQVEAEKELMSSKNINFFTEPEAASEWLQNA